MKIFLNICDFVFSGIVGLGLMVWFIAAVCNEGGRDSILLVAAFFAWVLLLATREEQRKLGM